MPKHKKDRLILNTKPREDQRVIQRGEMLREGISLTEGDRNRTYGSAYNNMDITGKLFETLTLGATQNERRRISPAEMSSLFMVAHKMARMVGGKFKVDNYVDAANFAVIAGECASVDHIKTLKEQEQEQE